MEEKPFTRKEIIAFTRKEEGKEKIKIKIKIKREVASRGRQGWANNTSPSDLKN